MAAYNPTTWVAGTTKVNPTNMNKIEQGIAAALPLADLLTNILAIDGTGTGIDADKIDGKQLSELWADTDIVMYNAQSGYIKFKLNGFMIQWGKLTAHAQSYTNSLFYTSFPNYCHTVIISAMQDTGYFATAARVTGWATTGFSWDSWHGDVATTVGFITYVAFGY